MTQEEIESLACISEVLREIVKDSKTDLEAKLTSPDYFDAVVRECVKFTGFLIMLDQEHNTKE